MNNFKLFLVLQFLLAIMITIHANAQVLYNNGSDFVAKPGAVVQVNGSLQNEFGLFKVESLNSNVASIYIANDFINNDTTYGNGNIFLNGNWINNSMFQADAGSVFLEGDTQVIGGNTSTTFYNLSLSGTGVKRILLNQYINNHLSLTDRELNTSDYNLFIQNPDIDAISRTTGFISSSFNGYLCRKTDTIGSYLFPVGSGIGSIRYRPVEIIPQTSNSNTFGVNMRNCDATSEGFNRNLKEHTICYTNPLFYHKINRLNGNDSVKITMFYDAILDGIWDGMANWTSMPQWKTVQGSININNSPLSQIEMLSWNSFDQTPFILNKKMNKTHITSPSSYCQNQGIVQLSAIEQGGVWHGFGVVDSILGLFDTQLLLPGTHTISYSMNQECMEADTILIQIYELPSIYLGNDTVICSGETLVIDAGANNQSFQWSNGETTQTITIVPLQNTNYSVTVTNSFGCTNSDEISVSVEPIPFIDFLSNPTVGCSPLTVDFSYIGPIGEYLWNFGDGNSSPQENPTHTYNNEGSYTVTLTIQTTLCDYTTEKIDLIRVDPLPEADFYFYPDTCKIQNSNITFYSNSTASNWKWDFGDGNFSSQEPPVSNKYPEKIAEYMVTLTLSNSFGCRDTISKSIICVEDVLEFPNIFTPNGDGYNDYLIITNAEKYPDNRIQIFNRWGKLVYEKNYYDNTWDGNTLSDGNYYYVFFYMNKSYHSSLIIAR